ncbi:MAG: hypothetical protein LM522_15325 [Candidatus Contendobacter sp.]|nr:hypothetical protein [Candidatus Contendobacter sp.]
MNRIQHTLLTLLFAAAGLALGGAAQAANVVTYDFSQVLTEKGSVISETLSLDLNALANPPLVTLAEFNSLADYSLTVTPGPSVTTFRAFTLTDENSHISQLISNTVGAAIISATSTALTFQRSVKPGDCGCYKPLLRPATPTT